MVLVEGSGGGELRGTRRGPKKRAAHQEKKKNKKKKRTHKEKSRGKKVGGDALREQVMQEHRHTHRSVSTRGPKIEVAKISSQSYGDRRNLWCGWFSPRGIRIG